MNRREFIVLGGAVAALTTSRVTLAADWPNKSVVVISAYPPGGTSDIIARLVADLLTAKFGQQFVIENLAGAAGALAGGKLARSAPDGYTILVSGSAPIAANKVVQTNLAYDPEADFTPITIVAESPALLTASAKAPAKTPANIGSNRSNVTTATVSAEPVTSNTQMPTTSMSSHRMVPTSAPTIQTRRKMGSASSPSG